VSGVKPVQLWCWWPAPILGLKLPGYAIFESMNWRSWDLEIFDLLFYAVIAALLFFVIYEAIP
jgi:hypothetical protein